MRRGDKAGLVYDRKGNIFGIFTGSDACSEHEWGTEPLQSFACSGFKTVSDLSSEYKKMGKEPFLEEIPAVADLKSINNNISEFILVEREGHTTIYSSKRHQQFESWEDRELNRHRNEDATAAWNDKEFAFRVYGEKLSKKLKIFFDALKTNDCIFAGALTSSKDFSDARASGIMVARKSMLRPEHHELLKFSHKKLFEDVLLDYHSKVESIQTFCQGKKKHIGHIWPIWKSGVGSEVVYRINPSYDFQNKISYSGPYTENAIIEWVNSGCIEKMKTIEEENAKSSRKLT